MVAMAVTPNTNEVIIIKLISFAFDSAKIEHLFAKNIV